MAPVEHLFQIKHVQHPLVPATNQTTWINHNAHVQPCAIVKLFLIVLHN